MAFGIPPNLLGIAVVGDLGDITHYTDRFGKIVCYPKVKEQNKRSVKRNICRSRFKYAQQCWAALSIDEKRVLEEAARRVSITMTGQNLYISCCLRNDPSVYQTVAKQSGLDLPPLPKAI